jgi:hypothetical protein
MWDNSSEAIQMDGFPGYSPDGGWNAMFFLAIDTTINDFRLA